MNAGQSELEWVVVSYALTFATFMLTGGKLADYFGRRRLFMIGLVVFTCASLACGLAPDASFLIGARAAQGIGAAIMNPATLGIITATFPPRQRGMAIGIWAGVSAMALAIGPLTGGFIAEKLDWSWIFFVNVPIGILGIIVARWAIDESRDMSHEQRLDFPGLVTSAVGLFSLTYALIESNTYGWTSPRILVLFGIAAVALDRVRSHRAPLSACRCSTSRCSRTPPSRARTSRCSSWRSRCSGSSSSTRSSCRTSSATRRSRPARSFLPMTILIILVAPVAGKFSDRVGSRWFIGVGMTLVSLSLVLFAQLEADSTSGTSCPAWSSAASAWH